MESYMSDNTSPALIGRGVCQELRIPHTEVDLIQAELEANKPYEACGLMIGTINDFIANVEKTLPFTNVSARIEVLSLTHSSSIMPGTRPKKMVRRSWEFITHIQYHVPSLRPGTGRRWKMHLCCGLSPGLMG